MTLYNEPDMKQSTSQHKQNFAWHQGFTEQVRDWGKEVFRLGALSAEEDTLVHKLCVV